MVAMDATELLSRVRDRAELPEPEERRRLRLSAKVTTGEGADFCGVTREAFRQWEAGRRNPRPPHLAAYSEFLATLRRAVGA